MANKTLELVLQHPNLHFSLSGGANADSPIVLKDHYFMYHTTSGPFLALPEGQTDSKYYMMLDCFALENPPVLDTLTITVVTTREDHVVANVTSSGLQSGGFLNKNNPQTADNQITFDVNGNGTNGSVDSFNLSFTITYGGDTKHFRLDPTVKLRTDPNTLIKDPA